MPAPGCEDLASTTRVNPLFEGRRECRCVAPACPAAARERPAAGYVRIGVRTGETQKWYAGNRTFCEELVVVPRRKWWGRTLIRGSRGRTRILPRRGRRGARSRPRRRSGCWLLGMLADHGETPGGRTCVAVFDGADVSAGPVAKIFLTHRVPHGLHGAFVPRRERTEPRSSERSVSVKK